MPQCAVAMGGRGRDPLMSYVVRIFGLIRLLHPQYWSNSSSEQCNYCLTGPYLIDLYWPSLQFK